MILPGKKTTWAIQGRMAENRTVEEAKHQILKGNSENWRTAA
jgi:hypothetical protein